MTIKCINTHIVILILNWFLNWILGVTLYGTKIVYYTVLFMVCVCRMMVFGVLTLILSWASLGADVATAVVSISQQACLWICSDHYLRYGEFKTNTLSLFPSKTLHVFTYHSVYVMLFGFDMHLRRVTVSPLLSKACLCGKAWQILVKCCLLAWRRW